MPQRRALSGAFSGVSSGIERIRDRRDRERTIALNDQIERSRQFDLLIAQGKAKPEDKAAFMAGRGTGPSVQTKLSGLISSMDDASSMQEVRTPESLTQEMEAEGIPSWKAFGQGSFTEQPKPQRRPPALPSAASAPPVSSPDLPQFTDSTTVSGQVPLPSRQFGPVDTPNAAKVLKAREAKIRSFPPVKIGSGMTGGGAESQPIDILGRHNPDTGFMEEVQDIAQGPTAGQKGVFEGESTAGAERITRPGHIARTSEEKKMAMDEEARRFGMAPELFPVMSGLADDYEKQSIEYFLRESAFRDIVGLSKQASTNPAAGIGLVFKLMKLYDPTSTVREGEQNQARNTAPLVPDWLWLKWNSMLRGQGILPAGTVQQFLKSAKAIYDGERVGQNDRDRLFTERANKLRIPAHLVIRPPAQDVLDASGGVGRPQYEDPATVTPLPRTGR